MAAVVLGAAMASQGGTAPRDPDGSSAAPVSDTATTTSSPAPTSSPSASATPRGDDALVLRRGRVVDVVDGDTIDLADGTRVRLAIVDTPEVHGGHEPCGPEASAFTRDLVLSAEVVVLRPSTAPATDDFGRLLGEVVRTADGASLNVALAAAGLGTVDERFTSEDPDLAVRARAAQADAPSPACAPVTSPEPTPAPPPGAAPPPSGGAHTGRTDGGWDCHAAYRECLPAG